MSWKILSWYGWCRGRVMDLRICRFLEMPSIVRREDAWGVANWDDFWMTFVEISRVTAHRKAEIPHFSLNMLWLVWLIALSIVVFLSKHIDAKVWNFSVPMRRDPRNFSISHSFNLQHFSHILSHYRSYVTYLERYEIRRILTQFLDFNSIEFNRLYKRSVEI